MSINVFNLDNIYVLEETNVARLLTEIYLIQRKGERITTHSIGGDDGFVPNNIGDNDAERTEWKPLISADARVWESVKDALVSLLEHQGVVVRAHEINKKRPISTAPRDGSVIILICEGIDTKGLFDEFERRYFTSTIAYWHNGGWKMQCGAFYLFGGPTHWMPLLIGC